MQTECLQTFQQQTICRNVWEMHSSTAHMIVVNRNRYNSLFLCTLSSFALLLHCKDVQNIISSFQILFIKNCFSTSIKQNSALVSFKTNNISSLLLLFKKNTLFSIYSILMSLRNVLLI